MNKKETNGGFKVSDKRHFAMEDDGTVKKRKAEEKAAETEAAAPAAEKPAEAPDIDLDFSSFVFSLSTSTMIFLGILPDPVTEKTTRNLAVAKQHIDLLGMLQEKTAGNLTPDEAHFLEQSLYDLRMKFVEVCNPKP
jgi:hypothetical protein